MDQAAVVLALDSGSQSSRALLFDTAGHVLAMGQREHAAMKHPMPGAVEQDPIDIRESLFESIRQCLAKWNGDLSLLAGTALTTQRSTVLPLAEDGSPLMDATSWLDRRAASIDSEPSKWLRMFLKIQGRNALIPRLLAKSWPRQWRERNPEILAQARWISSIEGWLNHELTGRVAVAPGGVVGPWPFDVKKLAWSDSALLHQMLGYQKQWLPPIVQPAQPIGAITEATAAQTGLPAGLPVYACGGDKQAEALGAGLLSSKRGAGAVSLGTGSSICVPWRKALQSRRYDWLAMAAAEPGAYCLEYLVFRGMWTARWFAHELARDLEPLAQERGKPVEALLCDEAKTAPVGCDGLMVWPRWSPTLQHPMETGAAVGLRETHTRAHFFRALLEGIAFDLRRGRGILEKVTGTPIEWLAVAGGGARSSIVVQILADVMGLPVVRPLSEELSARGAGMVAALGAGIFHNVQEAVESMASETKTVQPVPADAEHYVHLYREVYLPGLASCHKISATLRAS